MSTRYISRSLTESRIEKQNSDIKVFIILKAVEHFVLIFSKPISITFASKFFPFYLGRPKTGSVIYTHMNYQAWESNSISGFNFL
jgi:hypothetical protein